MAVTANRLVSQRTTRHRTIGNASRSHGNFLIAVKLETRNIYLYSTRQSGSRSVLATRIQIGGHNELNSVRNKVRRNNNLTGNRIGSNILNAYDITICAIRKGKALISKGYSLPVISASLGNPTNNAIVVNLNRSTNNSTSAASTKSYLLLNENVCALLNNRASIQSQIFQLKHNVGKINGHSRSMVVVAPQRVARTATNLFLVGTQTNGRIKNGFCGEHELTVEKSVNLCRPSNKIIHNVRPP